MNSDRRVTLKDVARAAGLSVSAVSYALRRAANIPEKTAERVQAVASKLGYRPNARVGELMAHIRRARPLEKVEPLALVYVQGDRISAESEFSKQVETAARKHATECGYRLDTFRLTDVEGNARRLAGILRARGVSGVLFFPTAGRDRIELNWPWEDFAVAVLGMSELNVALPRAGHHHYEAMREVLRQLASRGATHPVLLIDAATNARAHRGWQAAWLVDGPIDAPHRLWLQHDKIRASLSAWLKKLKPDAVIVDSLPLLRQVQAAGWKGPNSRVVLLSWVPTSGVAGIEQGYDTIAAHAVDLVVTQLQHNQRGLPTPPPMLLFSGRWRDAE
ncbi:MAG TPA: LacI family DNA-binding transcriptional regulator [Rariglobus sp.]|jgi:LacI family transcriptional regulator|nr:LacI family DNA-binding transcriptional regulator [Rariglobus sp.]